MVGGVIVHRATCWTEWHRGRVNSCRCRGSAANVPTKYDRDN
jgi:hypothetical protein